jgi:hypothetical protein
MYLSFLTTVHKQLNSTVMANVNEKRMSDADDMEKSSQTEKLFCMIQSVTDILRGTVMN